MFVPHKELNVWHLMTAFFRQGEENNWRRLGEEARAGTEMAITAYGIPLNPFASLEYLGRVI